MQRKLDVYGSQGGTTPSNAGNAISRRHSSSKHHRGLGAIPIMVILLFSVLAFSASPPSLPQRQMETKEASTSRDAAETWVASSGSSSGSSHEEFQGGIVGVLTVPDALELRNKARTTWMAHEKKNKNNNDDNPRIQVFFLLDTETPDMLQEQDTYGDLIFLNASYTGRAVRFGEKLSKWFQYAHQAFPKAAWVAKMDDDVAFCPTTTGTTMAPQDPTTKTTDMKKTATIFDFIQQQDSSTLYLGWMHNFQSFQPGNMTSLTHRIDEMFVAVGGTLIERLSERQYCDKDVPTKEDCDARNGLHDTGHGGTSLGLWLSNYSDVNIVPINDRVIQYGRREPVPPSGPFVCLNEEKLIFHKATTEQMDSLWGASLATI